MSDGKDDLKDAYAQFGLTFSHGCNIEGILANLILTSDFVKTVLTESKKAGKPFYEPDEAAHKLEEYLGKQHAKTMGALIGSDKRADGVKEFIKLDSALDKRVDDALRRRNYLAHNFWRERGGEVISVRRRNLVHADLLADQQFFEDLAKDLEALLLDQVAQIGMNADKLRTKVDESVARVRRELAR